MTARRPHHHHLRRQRGVTLIVALFMLVALGLLAAWAARSSATNLRVVGNEQSRQMALDVAQTAIEQTISGTTFGSNPAALAAVPVPVDVDGAGNADMTARITPAPTCYRWVAVKQLGLDAASEADRACMGSSSGGNTGIDDSTATANGNSLCADSEWNIRAVVTDAATGAQVRVNQGVAMRGLITDVVNNCP